VNPKDFLAELKRRNVYKVAIAYAVIAWLLIQAASILFPTFEAPGWVMRVFVTVLAFGFPIALILAWAFELTPEGIKRAEDVAPGESITRRTGRKLIVVVFILLSLAVGLFLFRTMRSKPANAPSSPAQSPEASPFSAAEKSIAVLPFENLSDDKQNSFFTDGVQDEILTDLAKVADLKVISRTSVMQYKTGTRNLQEIARALKVSHVVEGTVQRSANRVRVTAQLIDARTDTHLWAEKYDRELSDVFAIQSEIAKTIADELQAKISPKEKAALQEQPTKDMAAYDLYLRAKEIDRTFTNDESATPREIALLDEAVARDPSFVSAYCLLAQAHLDLYWYNTDHTSARLDLAKKALDAAARLKPDGAEVHLTRAIVYYHGYRDYSRALAEIALVRRSLPNDSTALRFLAAMERRQGQLAESTKHWEQAVAVDPQNTALIEELSSNYRGLRRYAELIRLLDDVLSWKPNDFGLATARAFVDFDRYGDLSRLQALLTGDAAKSADPDELANIRLTLAFLQRDYLAAQRALADYRPHDFTQAGFVEPREATEGAIWDKLGDASKASAALLIARARAAANMCQRPEDPKALSVLAQIDAQLNRKNDAIREGEQAVALLPIEKDALDGPFLLNRLARVYAKVGEKTRALELLDRLASIPFGVRYGGLKLDPGWAPLRGDSHFEKIVASLAPTEAKK